MAARVMMMAGGTGGHVFPALAVAMALRERGHDVSWLGVPNSFESRVVPEYGFPMDWVDAFRLRGQGVLNTLLAPFRLLRAMWQASQVIRQRRPNLVIGMGGFVTGPGGLVSRLMRLPLVIHEQNAIPGMTNRWLSHIATRVLQAFPGSFGQQAGAITVGNPVRKEIAAIAEPVTRLADREGPGRLLIVGGSLGAVALNEVVPAALSMMNEAVRPHVRHQAGRGKVDATQATYDQAGVKGEVLEFLNDMADAYDWADLVVCRSGALTVTELATAGVASILVPFPHAVDDHQTHNAWALSGVDAAVLVQQKELTPELLAQKLTDLFSDTDQLLKMSERARAQAKPEAVKQVADICEEVLSS